VALGIAVAVWAGALTSSLQSNDKLIVISATVTDGTLEIMLSNQSPHAVSISQIDFNGEPVPSGSILGDLTGIAPGAGTTLTLPTVTGNHGISYPITVWLSSGMSYPYVVYWP
jgi:P pilus assembly chaperone PapD